MAASVGTSARYSGKRATSICCRALNCAFCPGVALIAAASCRTLPSTWDTDRQRRTTPFELTTGRFIAHLRKRSIQDSSMAAQTRLEQFQVTQRHKTDQESYRAGGCTKE